MLVASVNLHSFAASGSGLVLPVGKLTRVWKTFLISSQEPSQAAAGSRVEGELVVPTDIFWSVSELLSDSRPQPASTRKGSKGCSGLQTGPVEHVHAPRSALGSADHTAAPHRDNLLARQGT